MARDNSKGRGQFTEPLEIKYIQIPHEVYEYLFEDLDGEDIGKRKDALWAYVYHYFTNLGYDNLKLTNKTAFPVCKAIDRMTYNAQNNARWKCYDEFYKGDISKRYSEAHEEYLQDVKEKRKERNRRYYVKRTNAEYNPEKEHEEGKENLKDAMKKHGIEYTEEDFNY